MEDVFKGKPERRDVLPAPGGLKISPDASERAKQIAAEIRGQGKPAPPQPGPEETRGE